MSCVSSFGFHQNRFTIFPSCFCRIIQHHTAPYPGCLSIPTFSCARRVQRFSWHSFSKTSSTTVSNMAPVGLPRPPNTGWVLENRTIHSLQIKSILAKCDKHPHRRNIFLEKILWQSHIYIYILVVDFHSIPLSPFISHKKNQEIPWIFRTPSSAAATQWRRLEDWPSRWYQSNPSACPCPDRRRCWLAPEYGNMLVIW